MATALFINGIYDAVLTDILAAQVAQGGGESFLQPYKGSVISMLRENPPTANSPVTLYVSTTENLSKICYTAEIVKWEDKRELSEPRRQTVLHYLETYQTKECGLFRGTELGDGKAVNLITIRNLRRLAMWPPTSLLTKKSDGMPLKERTRAGGWRSVPASTLFDITTRKVSSQNDGFSFTNCATVNSALGHLVCNRSLDFITVNRWGKSSARRKE